MQYLVKSKYFGPRLRQSAGLVQATVKLKFWCRSNKQKVALKKFSKDNLCFKAKRSPELHAKGMDACIILRWLGEMLEEREPECSKVATAIWLANSFMEVLGGAGPWLDEHQRLHVQIVGLAFQKVYLSLASENRRRWYVRPKFHLLTHVLQMQHSSGRNPLLDSTWLDEDWIKRVGAMVRRCHKVTAPLTVLQRYLICLHHRLPKLE